MPQGTTLTPYTGPSTVTAAHTVIDHQDIVTPLTIMAPGVVIRDSKIHPSGYRCAVCTEGGGSVTIEDSDLSGATDEAVGWSDYTLVRVNVHDLSGDGLVLGSHVTVRDSFVHDLHPPPGGHTDGGQMQAGAVDLVVEHNTIDASAQGANSALFISPDQGPTTNGPVTIRDNLLMGGNYSLYVVDGDHGSYYVHNISVTGNRFVGDAQFGAVDVDVPTTWRGNYYDGDGSSVNG